MLITDLTHFLAADGSIEPKDVPAGRLVDYLAMIVVAATLSIDIQSRTTVVHWRKRPNRRPCAGKIETNIDPETKRIFFGGAWCVGKKAQSVTGKIPYGIARTALNHTNKLKLSYCKIQY